MGRECNDLSEKSGVNYGMQELQERVEQQRALTDRIYEQCTLLVDAVLAGAVTDEAAIASIMDIIMDFYSDKRFCLLDRRLCRYIFDHYPQLIGPYPNMFRLRFEEELGVQ